MTAELRADPFQLDGTTIEGKYRVASVVGDGGFGVVYRGVHKGFGELIAIKCLKLPHELDEAAREALLEQLREEGRILHRLSRATSGIVQALDVGAFTTPAGVWVPYLVLEWLEGQTLAELMRDRAQRGEGGMSLEETIRLLDPAARALAVAHAHKVAHRDVKPANLFVAEVGGKRTLKVLDFGIAKVLSSTASLTTALEATKLGPTAFTPRYGAPEQFNKKRGASGPWTDVFALALIFVELVSGKKALDGDDPTELYIASADPTLRPTLRARGVDVPDAVEAVLHKALGVEPKQRYADAGAFWDALVAASGTTRGSQPSTPEVAAAGAPLAAVRAAGRRSSPRPGRWSRWPRHRRARAPRATTRPRCRRRWAKTRWSRRPSRRAVASRACASEATSRSSPRSASEVRAHRGERAPAARAPLWPWLLGAAPFLAAAAWGVSQPMPATPTAPIGSGSARTTNSGPPAKVKPGRGRRRLPRRAPRRRPRPRQPHRRSHRRAWSTSRRPRCASVTAPRPATRR
ncbi:MAG: serine/threonine-protein kinase [Polyangiaceae bacterium]